MALRRCFLRKKNASQGQVAMAVAHAYTLDQGDADSALEDFYQLDIENQVFTGQRVIGIQCNHLFIE